MSKLDNSGSFSNTFLGKDLVSFVDYMILAEYNKDNGYLERQEGGKLDLKLEHA